MKSRLSLILFFVSCVNCFARDNFMNDVFNEYKKSHHLQSVDTMYIHTFVASSKTNIKPKLSKTYVWYMNNTIHSTVGNYGGKLLNGEYMKLTKKGRKLVEKGNYSNGLKDGAWYKWNSDGSLKEYTEYKKGTMDGKYIQYAADNTYAVEGFYKNNLKTKSWSSYKEGQITSSVQYKNGKRNGNAFEYDMFGNITKQEKFKDDKLNGQCITFKDNKVISKEKYKNGTIIPQKERRKSIVKNILSKKSQDRKKKDREKVKVEKTNKTRTSNR